jgi:hypothetical protein
MAEQFRIAIGGPLHRMERATHLGTLRQLILAALIITWVPLLALSLAEWLISHRVEPMLRDLSVHARLVVTLPLIFIAERTLDRACRYSVDRIFDEGFVPPEQTERARSVLRRAERWRDAAHPEAILFVLAVASGLASLVGILPPAGILHGLVESRYSAARIWYALVSLPLFQFVLWRSLFRWALWAYVLGGLSRIPLRLLPTHADRRGGIGFLKRPSIAYGAFLLLAVSCTLSSGWATQILLYGAKIDAFKPLFVAFVVVGTLIAFAPLLAFAPQLFAARRQGRHAFGGLVTDYSRQFQERWIDQLSRDGLLGCSDFQSLADISNSYRENIEKMQVLLFDRRDCVLLFVFSQLPALPLLLWQVPTRDVLKRLLHLLAGGMPG